MGKSAGYVSADYLRKAAELTQALKQKTYERMQLAGACQVLDLGCGPGVDTVALAKHLAEVEVVGVDIDEEMLAEADALAVKEGVQARVQHQQADVQSLPFADQSFDALRAERLYQVLPASVDRYRVLDESLRVLKPGGRIVLADTDWATASVDFDDTALERSLMQFFTTRLRPNGFAGRQFLRMLRERAVEAIEIDVFPLIISDYTQTPFGDWLCGEAAAQGSATAKQIQHWRSTLEDYSDKAMFYFTVNMVVVSGVKAS